MRESKECLECGGIYFRPEYVHKASEWAARKYCSVKCANEAQSKRLEAEKVEVVVGLTSIEEAMKESPAEFVSKFTETSEVHEKLPVIRDLRIVRVGPNPRLVTCEYWELAERRLCRVLVKRTQKFVKGMRFKLAEPREESAYERPWVYEGPPPRHRGRW